MPLKFSSWCMLRQRYVNLRWYSFIIFPFRIVGLVLYLFCNMYDCVLNIVMRYLHCFGKENNAFLELLVFLKCHKAVFMLLMTAFCHCSQCAHAISGRSSSQPFRGTSHKSSVSSRSSSLKCFMWSLIRSTPVEASQYYINHHYLLFCPTPGHLKPTIPLDSNHLRC